MTVLEVAQVDASRAPALLEFANQAPLAYNDFASIATLLPDEPRVWVALDARRVVAAAIDDGLAMSVAGARAGLEAIAAAVPELASKLVVAGRTDEVRMFVEPFAEGRRERPEHFMAVNSRGMLVAAEPVPLGIADESHLPMLSEVRAAALEEEYGIEVDRDGPLYGELRRAVERAVRMQGVAIWVEEGRVAFTAQLIAKTPQAAMFGDLYTDPELRGAGRATRALAAFCVWLMSESEHVALRVGVDNRPAVRLYERVGFRTVDSFLSSLRGDQYG